MRPLPKPLTLSVLIFLASLLSVTAEKTWASLEVNVPRNLSDLAFSYPEVPVFLGQPEQRLNMTIHLGGEIFAAYSEECVFCAGLDSYNPSRSDKSTGPTKPWSENDVLMGGNYFRDTVNFGHILDASDVDIVVVDHMSKNQTRARNGYLPLYVNNTNLQVKNTSTPLVKLWQDGHLNPVIGLRLDSSKPRLTIGALDPSDYQGEINWVQMAEAPPNRDFVNGMKIDGVKGYNGSFLPMGEDIIAAINSFHRWISIPEQYNTYAANIDYVGPDQVVNVYVKDSTSGHGGFGLKCDWDAGQIPPTYFTVTINGVDYPMNDMIVNTSILAASGFCNFNLRNTTQTTTGKPDVVLGAPFLRSVYLAYRFPTESCPGYYGFAFLSNPPYPIQPTLISQKPTSTPSQHSECIANLITPTSTPSPSAVPDAKTVGKATGQYWVYKRPQDGQVPLLGIEELPKGVWNSTN